MPCDSSYLNPTQAEEDSLAALGFLRECGLQPTGKEYHRCYGNPSALEGDVVRLCDFLRTKAAEWIRDNTSLELQIFWRDHKRADKAREKRDADRAIEKARRDDALKKLTKADREALGLK